MLGLVGGDEAVLTLSGLLADKDVGEDARQALQRIPGQSATGALIAALDRATPAMKPGFINALAHRGATEAAPKLVQLASDANQDVRLAALAAVGRLGDTRGIPVVATALGAPDAADRAAAADALLDLADARLAAGDQVVARRMAERVLRSNVPTGRRVAALTGIQRLDDPASLPAVLQSLGDRNPVFHAMAMALIDRFAGRDVVQVMKDAAQTASPAARAGLMLGLASRDDGTVAGTLREALTDPSEEVKAAAATGLGVIGDQDAAPALLKLADTGSGPARPAALNSYLKLLAARLAQSKDPALLALYNHALGIAAGAAERNLALAGVAAFGDPSSLQLVEPLTAEDATREAALRAYVAIGKTLAAQGKADQAKTVFRNAIARGAPRDLAGDAAAQLRALGVQIDLAKESGFVSSWWLVGTFPNPNQGGFDTAYPPEKEADPARPVSFESKDLAWKAVHTDDVQGIVNLEPQFDTRNDVVAYAYAVISVTTEQNVTLKVGSDDAVKVWVNGRQVHANNAYRPLTVDEDTAQAHLKAGDNTILMKITQGGGQWSYCLRIVGDDGKPLPFEQRAAR
jgi:HEAT repeat protein